MIVSGSPVAVIPKPAPDWYGWGVEVQLEQGGKGERKLVLEDCTFEGAGLLDLVPGLVSSSLKVAVRRCAIRARAILACPQDRFTQLFWEGEGNHLEILENYWIVLSSELGTPAFSASVIDPESWSKFVAAEKDAIRTKLIYKGTPALRKHSQPQDFAIDVPDAPGTKVGAEPGAGWPLGAIIRIGPRPTAVHRAAGARG